MGVQTIQNDQNTTEKKGGRWSFRRLRANGDNLTAISQAVNRGSLNQNLCTDKSAILLCWKTDRLGKLR